MQLGPLHNCVNVEHGGRSTRQISRSGVGIFLRLVIFTDGPGFDWKKHQQDNQ